MKVAPLDGRYALAGEPQEGGAALVYKAADLEADLRHVAVKIFSEQRDSRLAPKFFANECQALQELRHPGIIELLDWGTLADTGQRFLVLEWMDGTLAERRESDFEGWDSFFDEIGRPVLEALAFAHGRSIWHRDLKPDNVLLDSVGHPKLADFSIAKVGQRYDPTRTVGTWGSPPFTAPEADDGSYSAGRDCWSFAALSIHCLTEIEFKTEDDLRRSLEDADLPEQISSIFEKCLSRTPVERPAHAGLLLAEIERVQGARAQSVIRRLQVHVELTARCREAVQESLGLWSPRDVQRVVQADLRDSIAVREYLAKGTEDAVPDNFQLIGTEFSYHAKVDGRRRDRLILINGQPGSVLALEQRRERSFQPNLEFVFAEPHKPVAAKAALEHLVEAFEDFQVNQAAAQAALEGQELFRSWRSQVQMKSDAEDRMGRGLRYVSYSADGRRVTFQLQREPDLVEIGEIRVASAEGAPRIRGEVEEVNGRKLTLYLTDGSSEELEARGELRLDTFAARIAIDRQKNALDAVQYGRSVRGDLGGLLISPEGARRPDERARALDFINRRLDAAKQDATIKALGRPDFLAVEGPPGTGKTTFIAEVVLQTLRETPGARVLIASQTHVALDNALEQIGNAAPDMRMIRVGRLETGKIGHAAEQWLIDAQLGEWRNEVVASSREFIETWAREHGLRPADVINAGLLDEFASVQGRLAELDGSIAELQGEEALITSELVHERGENTDDVSQAIADDLKVRQIAATDEADAARRDRRSLADERRVLIERLVQRKFGLDAKTMRSLSPEDARARARSLLSGGGPEINKLRRLLEIQSEWAQRFGRSAEFAAALITRASVVGATCIGFAGAAGTADTTFDVCILDEASRATPTEALVPMARARRWILVGDPKQLPPYVDRELSHDSTLTDYELTRQQLERTILDRLLALLPEESKSSLTIQHRMAAPIGRLVSDCFYDGLLRNASDESEPNPYEIVIPKRVTWVTTAGLTDARETRVGTSYANAAEARTVRELIKRLHFLVKGRGRDMKSVVLLAAYLEQCERLDRTVATLAPECPMLDIDVHTVDSFQGREADIVIYSITRSNQENKLGFLGDERRLNVALSRAKELLILVGDHSFCRIAKGENPLKPVLEHIERQRDDCAIVDAP
jgi:serine/threonine protein kinase